MHNFDVDTPVGCALRTNRMVQRLHPTRTDDPCPSIAWEADAVYTEEHLREQDRTYGRDTSMSTGTRSAPVSVTQEQLNSLVQEVLPEVSKNAL